MTMLGMVSLLFLMPVNYRAGAEAAHPHAFFQGMIDLITGQPHEHADDDAPARAIQAAPTPSATDASISPFTAPDIPLAAARGVAVTVAGYQAETSQPAPSATTSQMHLSPDTPQLTDLRPAMEQGAAIASIRLVITMLLIAAAGRLLWFTETRLIGWSSSCEPPPPRIGVCG